MPRIHLGKQLMDKRLGNNVFVNIFNKTFYGEYYVKDNC